VRRQRLDRHPPVEPLVSRQVHFAHAAGAERRKDLVSADLRPRREQHGSVN
jgi:hypothetical protein